jgi:hypothetical protein
MTSEFDDNEIGFGRHAVAMLDLGYTKARLGWLVTCAWLSCRRDAKVQVRRDALRVVDAVKPGDRRRSRGRRPTPSSPHLVQS